MYMASVGSENRPALRCRSVLKRARAGIETSIPGICSSGRERRVMELRLYECHETFSVGAASLIIRNTRWLAITDGRRIESGARWLLEKGSALVHTK